MRFAWHNLPDTPDGFVEVGSRDELASAVIGLFPGRYVRLQDVTTVRTAEGWQVNLAGFGPVGRLTG